MEASVGPVTMSGPGWVTSSAFSSMQISERLSQPFVYELEILSELTNLAGPEVLGHPVTISVEVGEEPRHFNAHATSLAQIGTVGRHCRYRLTLRPWLWFLSRTSNCRIFQDLSVLDIVKAVFRDHGFADFEERLNETYEPRPYTVQYRETDLQFVQRLLEHEGVYFFFEHTDSVHTLILCDASTAHSPTAFHGPLPYQPPDGRAEGYRPCVEGWEVRQSVETGALSLTDFDFEKPSAKLGVETQNPAPHPHSEYQAFDFPGDYRLTTNGEAIAKRRLEELQAGAATVEAASNARGLLVGSTFTLEMHPVEEHNREYLVIAMSGTLGSHGLQTGTGQVGEVFRCHFSAMDSERQFRPPRITPKPVVYGAQTATVVGKQGEEIWTDSYGRVKLRFHWDRFSSGDERSSCWVRVAQVWAGNGFGSQHIPRIGQEVVVDFLEGDPDQPIVTGRVYNLDNPPPYSLPDNQTQSGIKSRSTKGGAPANCNEIRFEDKIGNEDFFMQAEKNQTRLIKHNRSGSVGADDSLSVGGNRSVSVGSNLAVTVGTAGAAKSTLNVTGTHQIDASDTIEIQAPTHIKLTCGGSVIEIKPDSITLSAGGGSKLVLDQNGFLESSGASSLLLDQNACASASGGASLLLDGNVLAESSAQSQLLLDGNAALSSLGDVLFDGTNIAGQATMQVTLEVETNAVCVSATGVDLSGATANINATGTVGVMAPFISIG